MKSTRFGAHCASGLLAAYPLVERGFRRAFGGGAIVVATRSNAGLGNGEEVLEGYFLRAKDASRAGPTRRHDRCILAAVDTGARSELMISASSRLVEPCNSPEAKRSPSWQLAFHNISTPDLRS
jgi:hypothetical protein